MKRVQFNYRRATKRLLSFICRALQEGKTLQKISDGLRAIVNSYEGLTRNERYDMYKNAYLVARHCRAKRGEWAKELAKIKNYDLVEDACRRVKGSSELRHKKKQTRAMIRSDTIFYLCSWHTNPAKDHKEYQGKIYVDRFWRMKVQGNEYYKVLSYIKNKKVATIQYIMGAPVYMTTRPYCKHYFVPMITKEVLRKSARKLVEDYGAITRDPLYNDAEYIALREHIYDVLSSIEDSPYLKKMGSDR